MEKYRLKTNSGAWAVVDMGLPWKRNDFCYLGMIYYPDHPTPIPWAWHEDGTSIDRCDRAFDLVDFPRPKSEQILFWLGADAETTSPAWPPPSPERSLMGVVSDA